MSNPFVDATPNPFVSSGAGNPFVDAPRPAPKPKPAPSNPMHQLQQFGRRAASAVGHGIKTAQYYETHPMEAWDFINDALPHALEGLVSEPSADPGKELRSAGRAVGRPMDEVKTIHKIRNRFHLNPTPAFDNPQANAIENDPGAALSGLASPGGKILTGLGHMMNSNQGVDSLMMGGFRAPGMIATRADPAWWLGEGGVWGLSKLLSMSAPLRRMAHFADPSFYLNREATSSTAGMVRGRMAQARAAARRAEQEFREKIEPHRDYLTALRTSPDRAVRRAGAQAIAPEAMDMLDRLSWQEMTHQARQDAMKAGYRPPPELRNIPAGNTLNRYDPDYFPTQATGGRNIDENERTFVGSIMRKIKPNAGGYQRAGGKGRLDDDVVEQLLGRFRSGSRNVENARAYRDILNETGFGPRPDVITAIQQLRRARTTGNATAVQNAEGLLRQRLAQRTERQAKQAASMQPGAPLVKRNFNQSIDDRKLGNIFLPQESALTYARRNDRLLGNDPDPAFVQKGGVVTNDLADATPLSGVTQQRRIQQSNFKRMEASAKKAQQNAAKTSQAASEFSLAAQKRVQQATDKARGGLASDLFGLAGNADAAAGSTASTLFDQLQNARTRLNLRDRSQVDKLLAARGGDTTSKLGKTVATMRDNLERRRRGEVLPFNENKVVSPSADVAQEAGSVAGKAMEGAYHAPIIGAARGRTVRSILAPGNAQAARATSDAKRAARNFLSAKDREDAARQVHAAQSRVGKWADYHLKRTGQLAIPKSLDEMFFAPKPQLQRLADINPLSHLSNLTRDATFSLAFPHGWNIMNQTLQGGPGLGGVLRGAAHAVTAARNPSKIAGDMDELRHLGQESTYAGHAIPTYSKLGAVGKGLHKISNVGQQALDKWDTGQKIAALRHLKAKGVPADQLGNELERIYGTQEQSGLVQLARGLGTFYPQFAFSTVPRTVANAVRKHPRTLEAMMAAQNIPTKLSESGEATPDSKGPHEYNLFPELNEGLESLSFPFGTLDYGVKHGGGAIRAAVDFSKGSTKEAMRDAQDLIPFNQVFKPLLDAMDPKRRKDALHDLMGLFGPRITPESKYQLGQKRRAQL